MNANRIKQAVLCVVWASLAVPLAVILTILMRPFWDWFEGASGIESLGHSGPASWCYIAVYGALVCVFLLLHWIRKRPG